MNTQELLADAKKLPWWAYAVAGGAVLGGVAYYRKTSATSGAQSAPASSAQAEYQPPDGLSMADLAGLPYDYYDWSPALTPGGDPLPSGTPTDTTTTAAAPVGTPGGPIARPIGTLPTTQTGTVTATPIVNPVGPFPTPTPTPTRSPAPAPAPAPQVYWHDVHAWPAWDSTLSGIAAHYGMSWQQLYTYGNDKSIIDSAAHAHGHYSQEYNWLFPGEELQVPSAK